MKTVVAALIQQNGRILICQRRRTDAFPLQWEFPGGKVKTGETPAQALVRELHEELGVISEVGQEIYRTRHRYAELPDELELVFLEARLEPGNVQNLAFEQILWAQPRELEKFDFLPADRELIHKLAGGAIRLP